MFIPVLGMMLSMSYEDKNKSEMIINSLPLQRKEIVIAKYIFVSILVALGGIFLFSVSLIQLQNENTTGFIRGFNMHVHSICLRFSKVV